MAPYDQRLISFSVNCITLEAAVASFGALCQPLADVPHVAGESSSELLAELLLSKLCCICVGGEGHWRSVALDPARRCITLFDPAGPRNLSPALRAAAEGLARFWNWEVCALHPWRNLRGSRGHLTSE